MGSAKAQVALTDSSINRPKRYDLTPPRSSIIKATKQKESDINCAFKDHQDELAHV